jgi:hypothetical protein
MKRKLTTDQLTEIAAAARMAEKLAARVLDDQRSIAILVAEIEAFTWPENLFGRMGNSLERRDYDCIEKNLAAWEQWKKHELPIILRRMERTATLIRGFVEFFKGTNGVVGLGQIEVSEDAGG